MSLLSVGIEVCSFRGAWLTRKEQEFKRFDVDLRPCQNDVACGWCPLRRTVAKDVWQNPRPEAIPVEGECARSIATGSSMLWAHVSRQYRCLPVRRPGLDALFVMVERTPTQTSKHHWLQNNSPSLRCWSLFVVETCPATMPITPSGRDRTSDFGSGVACTVRVD